MNSFLVLVALIVGFLTLRSILTSSCSQCSLVQASTRHLMKSRQIIDFSYFNARRLEDRLTLRAKPNHRLVLAFGICNSFTTDKKHVHRDFLKNAHEAIHNTQNWTKLSKVTKMILDICIKRLPRERMQPIPLAPLVRIVSFSLVLHVLFDVRPSEIDLDAAVQAAETINKLWIRSKGDDFKPSSDDKELVDLLNNSLKALIPRQFEGEHDANPLNLIIPAYETLWRIVLLTFASVANQNVDSNTAEELQDAINNVPQCFGKGSFDETRALAIAKEGLRLYPPTKRIYRATSTVEDDKDFICADVEACQRDAQIWGPDALEFKPTRFHSFTSKNTASLLRRAMGLKSHAENLKSHSYFPFGVGAHKCPASTGFGEKIITLLVVELARDFLTRYGVFAIRIANKQCIPTLLPSDRTDLESFIVELEPNY
ncbi:hypothetical protein GGS21DRAFT_354152 [Xylaria nigripes]|nr:hypothetical protein GGS21DRAFT_354152 [Xylaria nigripes]